MKQPAAAELTGDGIVLAPIAAAHTEHVLRWRNDPLVSRWFNSTGRLSREGHAQWLSKYLSDPSDYTFIIETAERRPVGMIALYHIDRAARQAEYGRLLIDPELRRRQLALAASSRLLDFAQSLGVCRVYLTVMPDNVAAIRLYHRLGFTVDEEPSSTPGNIRMILDSQREASAT